MALRARRLPKARIDLSEIWLYVATDDMAAADRLIDRFDEAVSMLSEQPNAGRSRPDLGEEIRSFPVGAYIVFYRPTATELEIIRILSAARDVTEEMLRH
jgi:toxin ParE1/3/4